MKKLAKNIISTITYYDVLDYPMTSFEIWKYLIANQDESGNNIFCLSEIIEELNGEDLKKHFSEYRGFYFLKDRKGIVEQRIERNKISNRKIKKARKIVFWLRFIPFIKMVAIAGRVGMKNSQSGSDIDTFIIFKHGKIFTGRFLTAIMLQFFGQRRHENKITNRICLNHFLSDEFRISVQDLYSSHSYVFSVPLYGGEVFQGFLRKNQWIKNYRPNFSFLIDNAKENKDTKFSLGVRKFLEIIFKSEWIERVLKNWQIRKIEKNPLTKKEGGMIIYSDFELAFWPDFENQGPEIFDKFKSKLLKKT